MGKSRKKPDSEVDPDPAVVASPATAMENVKVVGSKKQKIDNGDEEIVFDKSNLVEVPSIKSAETRQHTYKASISNEYKEEDKDDNFKKDHQHVETPLESVEVPPDEETTQVANEATISDDYEDQQELETPNINDSEVEMSDASSMQNMDQTTGSKIVLMENLSFLIKEEDVRNFFKDVGEITEIHFDMKEDYFTGHGHVEFTTAEAAQEALKLNNTSLLDKSVKLYLATEKGEHPTTTLDTTGSKTVYLGNLSFSIEEDDVRDFFKDVGEIASIRFAIRDDRFQGYGYIEFTTFEAAQEALKLNKKMILDRQIRLDLARERGASTPGSSFDKSNQRGGHCEKSNQRGGHCEKFNQRGGHCEKFNQREGHAQARTLYIRGFDVTHGFDNVTYWYYCYYWLKE